MRLSHSLRNVFFLALLVSLIFGNVNSFASGNELSIVDASEKINFFFDLKESVFKGEFQWYFGGPSDANCNKEGNIKRINGKSYVRVDENYSCEKVIQKINDCFATGFAANIINSNSFVSFKSEYLIIDNEIWYSYVCGPRANDIPEVGRVKDEAISLSKLENGNYVATFQIETNIDFPVYFNTQSDGETVNNGRYEAKIIFVNENNEWKIASYDFSEMIFQMGKVLDSDTELSEAYIKNCLKAIIINGYYLLAKAPLELAYSAFDSNPYAVQDNYSLSDSLSKISTWTDYLSEYASDEVVAKLINLNMAIKSKDGKLFVDHEYKRKSACNTCQMNYADIDLADISIENITESDASVVVKYKNKKQTVELTVDFQKTADGWKICGNDFVDQLNSVYAIQNISTGDRSMLFYAIVAAVVLSGMLLMFKKKSY